MLSHVFTLPGTGMYMVPKQYRNQKGFEEIHKKCGDMKEPSICVQSLTLLHSERPKLYAILAFLSATGLNQFSWKMTSTA